MKYKIMWDSLKDTAKIMIEEGIIGEVSWRTLLDLMQQDEIMFGADGRSNESTFLILLFNALEFGFACLGVLTLVLAFLGRIAYVG